MIRLCVAATLLAAGCASSSTSAPAPGTPSPAIPAQTEPSAGTPGRIQLGETADVGGVQVRFVEVVEDSRCPQNTTCVWEGRASVRLAVGAETVVLTISHGGPERPGETTSVVVDGRRIAATALLPFPGSAEAERGSPVQVDVTAEPIGRP